MYSNRSILSLKAIRFRRWNRKGYAVFAGLNKVISIGQIASSISDKALLKSKRTSLIADLFYSENSKQLSDEDSAESEVIPFELIADNFVLLASIDIPVDGQSQYLLTPSWMRNRSLFQLFYFKK